MYFEVGCPHCPTPSAVGPHFDRLGYVWYSSTFGDIWYEKYFCEAYNEKCVISQQNTVLRVAGPNKLRQNILDKMPWIKYFLTKNTGQNTLRLKISGQKLFGIKILSQNILDKIYLSWYIINSIIVNVTFQ